MPLGTKRLSWLRISLILPPGFPAKAKTRTLHKKT